MITGRLACLHPEDPSLARPHRLQCSNSACQLTNRLHTACFHKLKKRLPRNCIHVFETGNSAFFRTSAHGLGKANYDMMFRMCSCVCAKGFLTSKWEQKKSQKNKSENVLARKKPAVHDKRVGPQSNKVKKASYGVNLKVSVVTLIFIL